MEDAIHGVSKDPQRRKDSYPLILLIQGTKRLVEKLHSGNEGLVERGFTRQLDTILSVENRLILLLTIRKGIQIWTSLIST
jgi:hypothetical protein